MTVKDCLLDERVQRNTRVIIYGNNYYCSLTIPDHVSNFEIKEKFIDSLSSMNILDKEVESSNYEYVKNINERYCGISLKQ